MEMAKINSKHNRRLRKLYLDSRKSKRLLMSQSVHVSSTTLGTINCGTVPSKGQICDDQFNGIATRITSVMNLQHPNDYLDHEDQSIMCDLCNAKLWKAEAAKGNKIIDDFTSYSLCCSYGKVELLIMKEPPEHYKLLYSGLDSKSKVFLKTIRRYNSMFSFTSMGGKVDSSINRIKCQHQSIKILIFKLFNT